MSTPVLDRQAINSWPDEIRAQLRLALPLIVVQLGLVAMGVVDTAMMGRHSETGLAAVAMGHLVLFTAMSFAWGTLFGLDPLVTQAWGARDHEAIAAAAQRGVVLALVLGIPTGVAMIFAEPILIALKQPAEVVPIAADYCHVSVAGMVPFYLFIALRQTLQAMHRLRAIVIVIVVSNALNLFADWVLIFGKFGFPAMGAVGAAWATVILRWFMTAALLGAAWPVLAPYLRPWRPESWALAPLRKLFLLGLPIGVMFMLEIGAFATTGMFMGTLGANILSGHQIALNIASITFMIPLGLSSAATVRVGNAIGRGDTAGVRRSATVAVVGAVLFMSASALTLVLLPRELAALYAPGSDAVLAAAAAVIPVAGAFQVFDGTQVVASGLLRGAGDLRWPAYVHVTGFWLLGLPLGWWLTFRRNVIPTGPWWGIALGLAVVAVVMMARARHRLWGPLERLELDAAPDDVADTPTSSP